MNRQQKRSFIKQALKKGISRNVAEAYISVKESGMDIVSLPKQIHEDDRVKLDVEKIKSRNDYQKMNPKYKQFIEANENTVFTAHIERETLVSLKEFPEWLFWSGDVIVVGKENGNNMERTKNNNGAKSADDIGD